MNNKSGLIRSLISGMFRVTNKFSRVEKLPIALDNGETLSTREIHTVQAVGDHKVKNVTEVGEYFGVTKGAASQMVSRLFEKGFVDKKISSHSNKEYVLSLTANGMLAYLAHEKHHGQELQQLVNLLAELNTDELVLAQKVIAIFERVIDRRLKK